MSRVGAAVVAALFLGACGGGSPAPLTETLFQYSCCARADVDQVLKPGEVLSLHWDTRPVAGTKVAPARYVHLQAELDGPYADVSSLKANKSGRLPGGGRTLKASELTVDTWRREQVASSIALPADLPGGFYNLRFTVTSTPGNSFGGGSIVRVGGP